MSEENEQWINGGDCSKCRKQKYCGSKCNEYHRRFGEEVKGFFASKFAGCGIVSKLVGDAVESAINSRKWG